MTDPITITIIITSIASALVALVSAIHYKIKIKCCCCQTECIENETQKEIKKLQKISSIKSI